ncbi:DUF2202 domain-containing protein [Paractinoplanes rishiriensis]|uniref:DUF2202 domain-containing protein n=1 Tax=Paractinoplanes rishiriensis TaxID=1050105 RepID=A0A919K972_9ACTN|nr:DUF2202 domain-containing protein [Actinoplanes rishiriensis]GIF02060.1 hypothetical protein Ari01nite_95240 [Actinoplanes rishiriensis]
MLRFAYTVTRAGRPAHDGFSGTDVLRRPPGYLDHEQRTQLTAVADRLRLAHHLSLALAGMHPVLPAEAKAVQAHEVAAVGRLVARYGLTDPNAGQRRGRFTRRETQAEYDRLLAHGESSPDGAVAAAEEALRQLRATVDVAVARVHAPDVRHAYRQLNGTIGQRLRSLRERGQRTASG